MVESNTNLKTTNASKYLQQLCKHFAHKLPVEYSSSEGTISFPCGTCHLKAQDGALELSLNSEPMEIQRLQQVVSDHLDRFAFRENPTLNWRTNAT